MARQRSAAPAASKKRAAKPAEPKHYATLADILKAKAKGTLPRGAKIEIDIGCDVALVDGKGNRISDTFASVDVAYDLLRRLGFKVENNL